MRRIEDLKLIGAKLKLKDSVTGFSLIGVDTKDMEDVIVTIATGSVATNADAKYYFYHASGATTPSTSTGATAFTTNPTLTTAATASQRHAILLEGSPAITRKRYLIIKCSKLKASNAQYVVAHGVSNRSIPSTSTLGSYTSLVRVVV